MQAAELFGIGRGARLAVERVFVVAVLLDQVVDLRARVFTAEQHARLVFVGLGRLKPAELDAASFPGEVSEVAMRKRDAVVNDRDDDDPFASDAPPQPIIRRPVRRRVFVELRVECVIGDREGDAEARMFDVDELVAPDVLQTASQGLLKVLRIRYPVRRHFHDKRNELQLVRLPPQSRQMALSLWWLPRVVQWRGPKLGKGRDVPREFPHHRKRVTFAGSEIPLFIRAEIHRQFGRIVRAVAAVLDAVHHIGSL